MSEIDALRKIITEEKWWEFDKDRFVPLLSLALRTYATTANANLVQVVAGLYRHGLELGLDSRCRLELEEEVRLTVAEGTAAVVGFIPFILLDSDKLVASKATIDIVTESIWVDGELTGVNELRGLLVKGNVANRGAVLGALIAMGDEVTLRFAEELLPMMTIEDWEEAAVTHTTFPQHLAIQFWLKQAFRTVDGLTHLDQRFVGICAVALILMRRHAQIDAVLQDRRQYPAFANDEPIARICEWSLSEYAEEMAPTLYELEARELPPKAFSEVLSEWGLPTRNGIG